MSNLLDVVDLCLYHMLYNGGVHSQGVAGDREGVGADWHHHSHTHTGLYLQPDLVTQIDSGNYRYMMWLGLLPRQMSLPQLFQMESTDQGKENPKQDSIYYKISGEGFIVKNICCA